VSGYSNQVIVDISMSLDGYVAAPGADPEHGLGIGGDPLHGWIGNSPRDTEILEDMAGNAGAVIMGRRTFDVVDGPHGWGVETGYGSVGGKPVAPPCFVVTHSVPGSVRLAHRFTFVTDGLGSAVHKAREVAGAKNVMIMGGGDICYQFLCAGLVDVLSIHLAPVVLGGGSPLFPAGGSTSLRLELFDSLTTSGAAHLRYRVVSMVSEQQ
jgi:dihydrofolate reductase